MAGNNSSSIDTEIEADYVGLSVAGVSTIACIIALGVLLYYKMWRSFIYRLVLYMFISLIVSSFTTVGISLFDYLLISDRNMTLEEVNFASGNQTNLFVINIILHVSLNGSQPIASLFVTFINASITLMALRNYQFTYRSDLCLLALSIVFGIISITTTVVVYTRREYDVQIIINFFASLSIAAFLVNFIFVTLTLVPLCCRACGYNLCMKTAATIESHRKALREILPLYILLVPNPLFIFLDLRSLIYKSGHVYSITFSLPGLICAVSFALHLCFIRKKLKNLRRRNTRRQSSKYGSVTHNHSTEFTQERISEFWNTEHIVVRESEYDDQFLIQRSGDKDQKSKYFV